MEHIRPNGLAHGYFCHTCGESCNMYASDHGEGKCEPNPNLVKQLIELNKPNFDEKKSTKTIVKVSVDGDLVADSKALAYATDNVGKEVSIGTDTMLTAFRLLRARDVIKELEIVFIRGYVMGGPGMSGPLTDVVSVDKNGSLASWPINDPITNANMDMTMELVGWKTGKVT